MARQMLMESVLVLVLATLMLVLAATLGLPGRPESPKVEAAEESAPLIDWPEFERRPVFEPRR